VVAQEQKAVLAKLFNHSEKQGGTQVGFKRMGPHAANAQGKPLGWIKCGLAERRFSSQRIQSSIIEIAGLDKKTKTNYTLPVSHRICETF
jgi:hypothetical protein